MSIRRQEALDYDAQGRPGKIEVSPTKPFKNRRALPFAYTPRWRIRAAAPRARARAAGGRRDAGRYRRGRADLDPDLSVLQAARTGQCAHFSESRRGERQLQAAQPGRRRGGHRPDSGGDGTACACVAAGLRRERYREHGRDRRRGRAGARSASARLNLSSESTAWPRMPPAPSNGDGPPPWTP